MEFLFTTEQTLSRADEVVDYLRGPRLWVPRTDYPDFDAWLSRVHRQLKTESKRAVLALSLGQLVGVVLYQPHRDLKSVLEIKNISIRPDARGRHVASFLLRNAEIEGKRDFGCSLAVVDAKARNSAIGAFLAHGGYSSLSCRDLYSLGAGEDVLYSRSLG